MSSLKFFSLPTILSSIFLVSIGILVIYSSSKTLAFQQILFAVVGLVFFFFLSQLDMHVLTRFVKPLYIFIIFLLLVVFFWGFESRGAIRWIPLGFFNVQASEFAKPVLILCLAYFWSRMAPSWANVFKSLLITVPLALLIFIQPDLGSALTLMAIWLGMLFASRVSVKKIAVLILVASLIIPAGWFFLRSYQRDRIIGFFAPQSDPLGRGYNQIQSTIAVGSGQLFGRGLGRGTQSRLQFLPEYRTDFIFASTVEELGFTGALIILVIYLFLLGYCLRVASLVNDSFNFLLVIGIFSMLICQIFVNIGMNIGILPITGITLPLISYGGSSLIATLMSLGLLSSVANNLKVR